MRLIKIDSEIIVSPTTLLGWKCRPNVVINLKIECGGGPRYHRGLSTIASCQNFNSFSPTPRGNTTNCFNLLGKGGKNRRRGKNENENDKRELVFKEDGQEYAQVVKMLGNGRLEANCFDGTSRLCHIRGKLRKKV